jgi:hypothetical protein
MFPDERHFISYLRLAPNLSISAGKKVPAKFKSTTCTRVAQALRMAATTLRNTKTALGAYYRRISYRKGASVAVFATARKLAQLVFRLVRFGQAYVDTGAKEYEAKYNQICLVTTLVQVSGRSYKHKWWPALESGFAKKLRRGGLVLHCVSNEAR